MNAIYARQSIDKGDSLSIQGQVDLCARQIQGEYQVYQDKGYSGKNIRRPAFTKLLEEIRQGTIRKVWVYRLDRFSRSIADFGKLWELLEAHQVEFESVSEKFDTSTPGGRAMLNIVMTFAQLERETTAQRVRDSYYQRLSLGSWPGGPPPLGFSLGKIQGPDGRLTPTLVPNPQQELVHALFQGYQEEGASLGSLARRMTEQGIPGIRGRKGWDSVAVSRVLKNPVYVQANQDVWLHFAAQGVPAAQPPEAFDGLYGCHLVGKRNRGETGNARLRLSLANHPGLVSADLWLACQEKLGRNRQLPRPGAGKHSWLSGLLKCKQCGYAVKITRRGETCYLHCSGHTNLGICDQSFSLNLRTLEGEVQQFLEEALAACPLQPALDRDTVQALQDLEERIGSLVRALSQSSPLAAPYLDREITRLEQKRQTLLAGTRQGTSRHPVISFAGLTSDEKKLVSSHWIEKILLDGEDAEIWWRI